ncbi:MAG: helix-turn-helix domain-containing protein [Alphaproteobacteria bacterium]|nr:helix-turn-helix domain-containing protein [Alphaproteobacteria bacterium]
MTAFEENEIAGPPSRVLLDALGVATALIDTQRCHVWHANRLFCETLQRSLEEVLKAPSLLQFVHPEDRHRHLDHTSAHMNGMGQRSRFVTRYVRPDGSNVHLRITLGNAGGDAGEALWTTVVVEEVAAPGGETTEDICRPGGDKVTIWSWTGENDAADRPRGEMRIFAAGNGAEHQSVERFLERVHPEDAGALQDLFIRSLKGTAGIQEYRLIDEEGGFRWMREMVAPIRDASGKLASVVGMSIDITDAKTRAHCPPPANVLSFVRHIEERWNEPVELSDLMRRYGVSARSLHSHFAALGTTPGNFLKRIRLAHARDLLSEPGDTTVAEVCSRCCFGNAGHFAKDYRTEFGELPSETLARARVRKSPAGEAGLAPVDSTEVRQPNAVNAAPDSFKIRTSGRAGGLRGEPP